MTVAQDRPTDLWSLSEPPQCMGGWCRSRDRCANYVAEQRPGREPAERLCSELEKPTPIRPQEVRP
jgi:hypothetical protein